MRGCLGVKTHTKALVTGAAQRALCLCTPTVLGITRAIQPWAQRTLPRTRLVWGGGLAPVDGPAAVGQTEGTKPPWEEVAGQGLTASDEEGVRGE